LEETSEEITPEFQNTELVKHLSPEKSSSEKTSSEKSGSGVSSSEKSVTSDSQNQEPSEQQPTHSYNTRNKRGSRDSENSNQNPEPKKTEAVVVKPDQAKPETNPGKTESTIVSTSHRSEDVGQQQSSFENGNRENGSKSGGNGPEPKKLYSTVASKEPNPANKIQKNSVNQNVRNVQEQKPAQKILKNFQHRPPQGDTIEVTFEVLLAKEMNLPDSKVVIVFGPPVSDWESEDVLMSKVDLPVIDNGNFIFLTGVLHLSRDLIGKTIPYKYVVRTARKEIWEHIEIASAYQVVNRCLIVPKVESKFTKFDDAILTYSWCFDIEAKTRRGREVATTWMLPRPSELDDPNFDFSLALQRFDDVIKAHGSNGTKVCIGGYSKPFNPFEYSVESVVQRHLANFLRRLRTYLKESSDQGKVLRAVLYICLVGNTKTLKIDQFEDFLIIFEAFRTCSEILFDESLLPESIEGDVQIELVESLKKIVKDFVTLPVNSSNTVEVRGDWIYVMPFIHHWDVTERPDSTWLFLAGWKFNVRSR
jgi:hypothetical protein